MKTGSARVAEPAADIIAQGAGMGFHGEMSGGFEDVGFGVGQEFADEFELTDENIQKHLENVMKKVKLENGDKANTPERLAPEIWERMKSTAKRNFIYEDIL